MAEDDDNYFINKNSLTSKPMEILTLPWEFIFNVFFHNLDIRKSVSPKFLRFNLKDAGEHPNDRRKGN